jgi:mannose-6-phosphate isomerase-like protein (cupin superfamily)
MAVVLEGQAEITIGGEPLKLKEGEMAIMPAYKLHVVERKKFKMLLVMIRSSPRLDNPPGYSGRVFLTIYQNLKNE